MLTWEEHVYDIHWENQRDKMLVLFRLNGCTLFLSLTQLIQSFQANLWHFPRRVAALSVTTSEINWTQKYKVENTLCSWVTYIVRGEENYIQSNSCVYTITSEHLDKCVILFVCLCQQKWNYLKTTPQSFIESDLVPSILGTAVQKQVNFASW